MVIQMTVTVVRVNMSRSKVKWKNNGENRRVAKEEWMKSLIFLCPLFGGFTVLKVTL